MSTGLGTPLVVANPVAGHGRAPVLPRLVAALRARGTVPDVVVTEAPGHATELARTAVEDTGRRFVVAVGGDGTIHEVVNGLVDATTGRTRGDDPVLGVVGAGSGSDLVRTFGLDRSPEVLADHLVSENTLRIDIGRIVLRTTGGATTTTRLFHNIAEAGYGATVVALANRLPRRLGRARYGLAIPAAVMRFRLVRAHVTVDHTSIDEPLSNVVVANGQFFGGGLKVAPRALPTDGRFNVQVWHGRPVDVLRAGRQLRTGAHLSRPDTREWQSARVEVDGSRPLAVEADGEPLGTTPASFDLLPQVLRLKL